MEILNFPLPDELTKQIEVNISTCCRKHVSVPKPSSIHKCTCVKAEIVAHVWRIYAYTPSIVPAPTHCQYINAGDTGVLMFFLSPCVHMDISLLAKTHVGVLESDSITLCCSHLIYISLKVNHPVKKPAV